MPPIKGKGADVARATGDPAMEMFGSEMTWAGSHAVLPIGGRGIPSMEIGPAAKMLLANQDHRDAVSEPAKHGRHQRLAQMTQTKKATDFKNLHIKGTPLVLYNAWDAGSAKAIARAGAKAIATSSWAVAETHGYKDGESIPMPLVEQIVGRIAGSVDCPVTVDFEGGYSEDDAILAKNVTTLMDLGVIGINFEDRLVKGKGLYPVDRQARRIAAIRAAAQRKGLDFFINARTDLFLGQGGTIDQAVEREKEYAAAGASGFFVPGLVDEAQIGRICREATLPINVMIMDGLPPPDRLSKLGVARISYGAASYIEAIQNVEAAARKALF
jgi:2-methylisocitrate lyase-like PEP mutase family enzyme